MVSLWRLVDDISLASALFLMWVDGATSDSTVVHETPRFTQTGIETCPLDPYKLHTS